MVLLVALVAAGGGILFIMGQHFLATNETIRHEVQLVPLRVDEPVVANKANPSQSTDNPSQVIEKSVDEVAGNTTLSSQENAGQPATLTVRLSPPPAQAERSGVRRLTTFLPRRIGTRRRY